MEPFKVFGGAEECHSSESGWTMYIGSPIDDDDPSCDNDDKVEEDIQAIPEDESDDSMASDASSGPSHYGFEHAAEEDYDDDDKYCPAKKQKEIAEKKVEKKGRAFTDNKSNVADHEAGGKVRKNQRMGKGK